MTILCLAFQPVTADAAHKKKKKAVARHRTALSISPIPQKSAKAASIIIDAETGTILSSDSPDALRHPASLTKMMTLLLVFDAIHSGKLRPTQAIRISARAASMPPSKLGIRAGESIRLDDAIASLATLSANDMAVALAETLGNGSESNFARAMTAKAQAIGMTRTRFYNASGLPNDYQVTTARDMARLARYLLTRYPQDSRIFSRQRFDYAGRTYMNHNHLMETYAGMDCCKTGYINASGFNLVASAKRGDRRLIGVVFGGRTTVTRNMQMASLLDDGFARAKNVDFAAAQSQAQSQVQSQTRAQASPQALTPVPPPPQKTAALKIEKIPTRAAPSAVTPVAPAPVAAAANSNAAQSLGTIRLSDAGGIGDRTEAPQIDKAVDKAAAPIGMLVAPGSVPVSAGNDTSSTGWSVQIGAYQTRLATDQAIAAAFKKLPGNLRKHQSTVVPLRTADQAWMFRARLTGYNQSEAQAACRYFDGCLAISPQAY